MLRLAQQQKLDKIKKLCKCTLSQRAVWLSTGAARQTCCMHEVLTAFTAGSSGAGR